MRIRHKGLRALHEKDDPALLSTDIVCRVFGVSCFACKMRLALATPMPLASGYNPLKGDRAGEWSVRVFRQLACGVRFEGGEVVDVDLVDYH